MTQNLTHATKAKKKEVKVDNSIYETLPFTFSKKREEKHTGLRTQNMHRRTAPVTAAVSKGKT